MRQVYIENLLNFPRIRILEAELIKLLSIHDYEAYLKVVSKLVENVILTPIGTKDNGKYPSYYSKFTINKPDTKYFVKDTVRGFYPQLNFSYYYNRINEFKKDLSYIRRLSDFLYLRREELGISVSINERSYQIFGDEKFLREQGMKLLNTKLKYSMENLNTYRSREPYFGYVNNIKPKNYILIIENLDTWYTAKKLFLENKGLKIFGLSFNILIYGEGNKIINSMEFIDETPYGDKINDIYYWGDIDNEGFVIFLELVRKYPQYRILLLTDAYFEMLNYVKDIGVLKSSKEEQRKIKDIPKLGFNEALEEKIKEILVNEKMVPQEILNYKVLKNLSLNYKG